MTHSNVLLELLHFPSGPVVFSEVLEQGAGEHGVELEEVVVEGYIQVKVELLGGIA